MSFEIINELQTGSFNETFSEIKYKSKYSKIDKALIWAIRFWFL